MTGKYILEEFIFVFDFLNLKSLHSYSGSFITGPDANDDSMKALTKFFSNDRSSRDKFVGYFTPREKCKKRFSPC